MQTPFTPERWINLGNHMWHGSVGHTQWRCASLSIVEFCPFRSSLSVQKGSADVFAGHLAAGLGFASRFVFPFDTRSHGFIGHVRFFKPIIAITGSLLLLSRSRSTRTVLQNKKLALACLSLLALVQCSSGSKVN